MAKAKYKKLLKGTHEVGTQLINYKVVSSWVSEIGIAALDNDRLVLSVQFKNGTTIGYTWRRDDQIPDWLESFMDAASKGKFIWQFLYHQPYTYLS